MRPITDILLPAGLVILAAGWANSDDFPEKGSLVDYCAYVGSNLTDNHWFGAYCRSDKTDVFGYNWTWIDLDLCLGNIGGGLAAYDSGNYSSTCTNCSLTKVIKPKVISLNCTCLTLTKEYQVSSVDLNSTLYDANGVAGCFDHLGNKTRRGP